MMNNQTEQVETNQRDILLVRGTYEEEIAATYADLFVTIRGSSFVTGDAALQKAREVNQLVTDLKNLGLTDEDIQLQGVQAVVSSGMLGKSSSAVYSLKIRCADLAKLVDVLGGVTSQKNTQLQRMEWGYDLSDEAEDRRLARAIERANVRARLIAQTLGVRLIGVQRFSEVGTSSRNPYAPAPQMGMLTRESNDRKRVLSAEDLDLEVSHTRHFVVQVDVEYRISEFTSA